MNKSTIGLVLDWCVNEYGHSKNVTHGLLKYRVNNRVSARGLFYPEVVLIEINCKNHQSLIDFIHTIIHEYQHYLQDQSIYDKHSIDFDDDNNPYEIEADRIAKRDKRKCMRKILQILRYDN